MVNYKTSVYLETQFKIYQEYAGRDFRIIIIDTSRNDEEYNRVVQIAKQFDISVQAVQLPIVAYSSEAHGAGLQHAYELVDAKYTQYFIAQDPDFFWVKPRFLCYLEHQLQKYTTIGAPYSMTGQAGWMGHPYFPAAFGAAYRADVLRKVEANFDYGGDCQKDVGWNVRDNLASKPYFYFHGRHCSVAQEVGAYSYVNMSTRYVDFNDETIAYHLYRGSFELDDSTGFQMIIQDPKKLAQVMPPEKWQIARKKLCDFFWKEINDAAKRKV